MTGWQYFADLEQGSPEAVYYLNQWTYGSSKYMVLISHNQDPQVQKSRGGNGSGIPHYWQN